MSFSGGSVLEQWANHFRSWTKKKPATFLGTLEIKNHQLDTKTEDDDGTRIDTEG